MNKFFIIIVWVLFGLISCKPTVSVMIKNSSYQYYKSSEEIEVLNEKDSLPDDVDYIGKITIHHSWKNKSCSYEKVLKIVMEKADELGSDLVKIEDHSTSKKFKSCHQIAAKFYRKDE